MAVLRLRGLLPGLVCRCCFTGMDILLLSLRIPLKKTDWHEKEHRFHDTLVSFLLDQIILGVSFPAT
jgi:hypothetical protein